MSSKCPFFILNPPFIVPSWINPTLSYRCRACISVTTTTSGYVYTKTSGTTGGATEGTHPNPESGGR